MTTLQDVADEALLETYEDVRGYILDTAKRFMRRFGGDLHDGFQDLEELIAEANYIFMLAYERHDEAKGPFIPWLKKLIWCKLLDKMRTKINRKRSLGERVHEDNLATPDEIRLADMMMDLPEDARTVAKLAVEMPTSLKVLVDVRGGTPAEYRYVIRNFLKNLGWAKARIEEAFQEVGKALRE